MTPVTELFLELVQIDSPTGHEAALAAYIVDWLHQHTAAEAYIDSVGNVVCQLPGSGAELEPLFFCAHMDTVEPGRAIHPVLSDDGEWITSDGTTILGADNKNAVAALLCALAEYSLLPQSERRTLEVLFTVSEESNNTGAAAFDTSVLAARRGYVFDAALPVGTVITASPFYARFDLRLIGRGAHAGRREDSIPVLADALRTLEFLESLRTDGVLINTGLLSGGTARNSVLGELELHGEIRAFDGERFQQAVDAVHAYSLGESPVALQREVCIENGGYVVPPESVESLQGWMNDVLGSELQPELSFGCSDANLFWPSLPVICCGSGGENPHTVHERQLVRDLDQLQQVCVRLMESPPAA